jgi:hypothetical protein
LRTRREWFHDPEKAKLPDWRTVHEVNLDGTFLGLESFPEAVHDDDADSTSGAFNAYNSSPPVTTTTTVKGLYQRPASTAAGTERSPVLH